jgi:hypothetical protein
LADGEQQADAVLFCERRGDRLIVQGDEFAAQASQLEFELCLRGCRQHAVGEVQRFVLGAEGSFEEIIQSLLGEVRPDGAIVWWDMLFGTYENPREWTHTCGFDDEREQQLFRMLRFEDVHELQDPSGVTRPQK